MFKKFTLKVLGCVLLLILQRDETKTYRILIAFLALYIKRALYAAHDL